ncbi:MAG: sigma-54-dependent Fis family transcriptional regulator [Candidatus Wallbacteria bacterium]|nr:sigma-54-dependent Fis family transcriptional regulator [Candidatus Wallbacteria bacterium]
MPPVPSRAATSSPAGAGAKRADAVFDQLGVVAESAGMQALLRTVARVASLRSTFLVTGESGTGKELIARALHALGTRAAGTFVPINCATLSGEILESELFGHERGAFTSADRAKLGLMEIADNGTLFLDEVSEMGPSCQAKLLRALERREFRRVGGTKKIRVDLGVVAASNVDLEEAVAKGRFRPDLYYRLKVVNLQIPPLRERREAIPGLTQRFLGAAAGQVGMPRKALSPRAMACLMRYSWPGNVRELKNCIESLVVMVERRVIDFEDLPVEVRRGQATELRFPVGVTLEQAEREIIRKTLESFPTRREAARVLGIGLRTLYTKLGQMAPGSPKKPRA